MKSNLWWHVSKKNSDEISECSMLLIKSETSSEEPTGTIERRILRYKENYEHDYCLPTTSANCATANNSQPDNHG